jgi:hypothetical protein
MHLTTHAHAPRPAAPCPAQAAALQADASAALEACLRALLSRIGSSFAPAQPAALTRASAGGEAGRERPAPEGFARKCSLRAGMRCLLLLTHLLPPSMWAEAWAEVRPPRSPLQRRSGQATFEQTRL